MRHNPTREALGRILEPLRRSIRLTLGLGILKLINDTTGLQSVQVQLVDGVVDGANHFQPYGFTSVPLAGAQGVAGAVGGRRGHTVMLVVDDRRYRKKELVGGEVALYTHQGDYIHFKNGRIVEVVSGTKVKVTAPDVEHVASTQVKHDTPLVDCTHVVNAGDSYKVAGTKVVGPQGAAVADPVGGGTVDSQCRAQLSLLLAQLRTHGLIAT